MLTNFLFISGLAEGEAEIVGTLDSNQQSASRLRDGLSLDGNWHAHGCAHVSNRGENWFSFELTSVPAI